MRSLSPSFWILMFGTFALGRAEAYSGTCFLTSTVIYGNVSSIRGLTSTTTAQLTIATTSVTFTTTSSPTTTSATILESIYIQASKTVNGRRGIDFQYLAFNNDFAVLVDGINAAALFRITANGFLMNNDDYIGTDGINGTLAMRRLLLPPSNGYNWTEEDGAVFFGDAQFCYTANGSIYIVYDPRSAKDCSTVNLIPQPVQGSSTSTTEKISTSISLFSSTGATLTSSTRESSFTTSSPTSSTLSISWTSQTSQISPTVNPIMSTSSSTINTSLSRSMTSGSILSSNLPSQMTTTMTTTTSTTTSNSILLSSSSFQSSSISGIQTTISMISSTTTILSTESSTGLTARTTASTTSSSLISASSLTSTISSTSSSPLPYSSTTITSTTPTTTSSPTTSSTSIPLNYPSKRGLAYTNVNTTHFYPPPTLISWAYDYFSLPNATDNLGTYPYPSQNLRFIPLLFNAAPSLTIIWSTNVQTSLRIYGADALFSFNEPDFCLGSSSACMNISTAISTYNTYLQPFSPIVRLGAPAVTNAGGGLSYLAQFLGNATQQNLTVDFVNIHWYASPYNFDYLTQYVTQAYEVGEGRPVVLSEFGMDSTVYASSAVAAFLKNATTWLDAQDFVERYAWFGNFPGYLLDSNGTGLSDLGRIYNNYTGGYVYRFD